LISQEPKDFSRYFVTAVSVQSQFSSRNQLETLNLKQKNLQG